jgi:hypothetical protein
MVGPFQAARVFIDFPVTLRDDLPERCHGDEAERLIDQPPGPPFLASRERGIRFRERLGCVVEHLPEQVQIMNRSVDAKALLPPDLAVYPGVALDRRFDPFEVLDVERRADSVKDFRQMVGELPVGQLVGLDEAGIAEHRTPPAFRQGGPLLTQEPGERSQGWYWRVIHDRSSRSNRVQRGKATGKRMPRIRCGGQRPRYVQKTAAI